MMTLAVALLALVLLGALTHFAPALRSGRTGYPSNRPVRTSRSSVDLKDLPRTWKSPEFTLTPWREAELVSCDQVRDGI